MLGIMLVIIPLKFLDLVLHLSQFVSNSITNNILGPQNRDCCLLKMISTFICDAYGLWSQVLDGCQFDIWLSVFCIWESSCL